MLIKNNKSTSNMPEGTHVNFATYYPANNLTVINGSNTKPTNNRVHRPSKYTLRKNTDKRSIKDHKRDRKKLSTLLYKYFNCKDENVFFVTLEFKDARIKQMQTAKQRIRKFLNKNNYKSVGVLEYNFEHHPHAHLILTSTKPLIADDIQKNWIYGFSAVKNITEYKNQDWEPFINYVVKIKSIEFQKDLAEYYYEVINCLKQLIKILKSTLTTNNTNENANIRKDIAFYTSKLKQFKRNYKIICQGQELKKDKPIVYSRGLSTTTDKNENITEILKKLKQQSTITYNITSRKDINPITGEINYEITNWTVKI